MTQGRKTDTYPYPKTDEIEGIVEAFDNLFNVIETKETDSGIALYSKGSLTNDATTGFTAAQTEAVVKNLNKISNKIGVPIEVISSDQVPAGLGNVKAYVQGNTAYLVHDRLKNVHDAEVTYAHEVKGHIGIENIVPDWGVVVSDYNEMKALGGAEFTSIKTELDSRYGPLSPETEVKEFIALSAERQVKKGAIGRFMDKVRGLFNKALRTMGFTRPFSMSDINTLLSRSEAFLNTPGSDLAGELDITRSLAEKTRRLKARVCLWIKHRGWLALKRWGLILLKLGITEQQ